MADKTRAAAEAVQDQAMQLVAWLSTTWIDSLALDESKKIQGALASILEVQARVTRLTARKHVARAMRRQRAPGYEPPAWGGQREGAGRPSAAEVEAAMRSADELTDYGRDDPAEAD